MGQIDYMRIAEGQEPGELLRKLQREAREENGSSGYSGTIAEARGLRHVPHWWSSEAIEAELLEIAERRKLATVKAQRGIQAQLAKVADWSDEAERLRTLEIRIDRYQGEATMADACRRERKLLAERRKALRAARWSRAKVDAVVGRLTETKAAKWGPALCLDVGPARDASGRRWVFFGLAAY